MKTLPREFVFDDLERISRRWGGKIREHVVNSERNEK